MTLKTKSCLTLDLPYFSLKWFESFVLFQLLWPWYSGNDRMTIYTGCPKKNVPKIVWMISPAANMLDGWDISYLRGGIYSSDWSTKTFMWDIRELRYMEIKIGYHNYKFQILVHYSSWNLITHVDLLIFWLLYVVHKWMWA